MLLEVSGLAKRFGDTPVVHDVSFALEAGETLALIGPSGCGKTTTLKMVNRLIEPDAGSIRLGGQGANEVPAAQWRRHIGYVIQSAGLFPHRSVFDNVAITPRLLGWDATRIGVSVAGLLDMVGLQPAQFAERMPTQLSGGQKQRVGLARALVGEPRLVLMDEPFAALDPVTKDVLIEDIRELRSRLGFAIVLVTHDFADAVRLADRIAILSSGRIIQMDTPEKLIAAPATPEVAALLAAPRRSAELISALFKDATHG